MVTKNMAYWKAKFKNSPIKQDDDADTEDTDTGTEDTDTGNEETSKSGGGGAGVGKDLAMAAGTAIINKALSSGKPKRKIVNPTSGGFSTMRFGS